MMRSIVVVAKVETKQVPVYGLDGSIVGEITLPPVFSVPVRKDIIRRAFLSALTARLQPKGRDELAGKRRVGESWGANYSVARVPRLDNGRAVFVPQARGGRLAFQPTTRKIIHERINKKERTLAIASALAATANVDIVRLRGHVFSLDKLPVIVVNEFEDIDKASNLKKILQLLKLWDDVVRAQEGVRIRSGKGKMRGRKYKVPKSILMVVSDRGSPVVRAGGALPGVDVVSADILSILHLAPGGHPGRLMIITPKALTKIAERFEVLTL